METKPKKIKNEIAKNAKVVESTKLQNNETVEDRVGFEIQKFEIVDSKIAEMKSNFKDLEIAGVDDKDGIKKMADALSIVRNLRTSVEKKRKELKDFYFNTGKGIDAEAKRIQDLIAEIEEPLKLKKKEIDDEIQLIKEQEEAAEQKILDDKVDSLKQAGIEFDGTFYSIGENISVNLVTIKDLDEEAFEKLRLMVANEKEKIDNEVKLQNLHEERKEVLLPFWSFLTSEMQTENFSGLSEERFNEILKSVKTKKEDFDKIQENQKAEAEKQIQERKDLNFEKRSFKLEKQGFEIDENKNLKFAGESSQIYIQKTLLQDLTEEGFEVLLSENETKKENILKADEKLKKEREVAAEENANQEIEKKRKKEFNENLAKREKSLIEVGFVKNGEVLEKEDCVISFEKLVSFNELDFAKLTSDAILRNAEIEKENAVKAEAERIEKLPEIEKIERYCDEILKINVPELKTIQAQNEMKLLHGEIKRSVEKTLSNIKTL